MFHLIRAMSCVFNTAPKCPRWSSVHKNLISTTPTKEPRLRSMALTAAINLSSKKTLDREAYGSHSCGKEREVTQVKI